MTNHSTRRGFLTHVGLAGAGSVLGLRAQTRKTFDARDYGAVGDGTTLDSAAIQKLWDGPLLSAYLEKELGVTLRVRQYQRLFRQLGFRLRKPRPLIAQADPLLQAAHKKTSSTLPRPSRGSLGDG